MAEQVQAVLDQMVAPLKDLMDRGIFSDDEIRAIVSRRRESEYLLRRRAARKADFLRYIEAEMNLEKLRAIRTRQVLTRQTRSEKKKENNGQEKGKKSHIGDAHVVAHIHFLFTRMLRKFRSDVTLHLQHAAFAKASKSFTRLGRIYSEALQVHPRNVTLWIEAASLEFFGHVNEKQERVGGGSVQNARVLLQRGLRVNSTSQDLWLQYFALELHHLQKLRGRREILQLGDESVNDNGDELLEVDVDDDRLFSQAPIAKVVYSNAIKAIPDDVAFRLKFLDLLNVFPQTDAIESVIVDSIKEDFHDNPDAWIARASFALERKNVGTNANEVEPNVAAVGFTADTTLAEINTNDGLRPRKRQRANQRKIQDDLLLVLQKATEQLPTNEMYVKSVQFARFYIDQLGRGNDYDEADLQAASISMAEARSFIDQVLEDASEPDVDLVLEHADYLASNGQLKDAVGAMDDFLKNSSGSDSTSALVWINLARLVAQLDPPRSPAQVLRKAMSRISIRNTGHMAVALELFGCLLNEQPETESEQEKIQLELSELFQRLLLLSPGEQYRGSQEDSLLPERTIADVSLAYFKHCLESGEMSAARQMYTSLLQSNYCQSMFGKSDHEAQVTNELFNEFVKFEKSTFAGDRQGNMRKQQKKRLSRIYEVAISFFRDADSAMADSYQQRLDEDVRFAFS